VELNEIRADAVQSASKVADLKTSLEEQQLKTACLQNDMLRDVVEARRKYPARLFWMIVCWLVGIGFLLFFQGFYGEKTNCKGEHIFHLDNSVLIAVISGLTVTIISMFIIIIRNLFPRHDSIK
jgi:hypothetical protein